MKKICDIILILLIIVAIIVGTLITIKYIGRQKNESILKEIVSQIENVTDSKEENIQMNGYNIEGIIEIPKINIKYPIIDETTDITMKLSTTKFCGNGINEIGNYTIAGHNNKDGTMFGKTKYLELGDTINIIDLNLNKIQYEIFKIYVVNPNDVTCLESVDDLTREITLITCTNGHANRLITKARQINN